MALAERVRIPCTRRAAERRGLVVAWRRRRRFGWEVPLGREEPPHAIPPSAPAATPHALDPLVLAAPSHRPAPPLSSVFSFWSPQPPPARHGHRTSGPPTYILYRSPSISFGLYLL